MVGKYDVSISTRRVRYDFSIKRKYTIINGDSGSGKTRLVKLIRGASRNRQIRVSCEASIVAVSSVDDLYREIDKGYTGPVIYFIDEDVCRDLLFMDSGREFARKTASVEGYFVLMSRACNFGISEGMLDVFNIVGDTFDEVKLYRFEEVGKLDDEFIVG